METSEVFLGLTVAEASARQEAARLPVPPHVRALPPRPASPLPELGRWRIVRVDPGPRWVITPPMADVPPPEAPCSG